MILKKSHWKTTYIFKQKSKSDPPGHSALKKELILCDEINQKLQLYIEQVSKQGGIISRTIENSAAKLLLESFGKSKIT